MKILVIGLGSMGKRRIRLIRDMYPETVIYGVDGREDRRDEAKELFQMTCFASIEEAADRGIEAAFVCTSPLSHNKIIKECLNNGWNVFTELNLVSDGYEENIALAEKKHCTLFLSSTFLYREEIQYIRQKIKHESWNYIYHIGQYLPDWHPWENYKDFFIGDKRTNGCREIMAIELPWLTSVFGKVINYRSTANKMTALNIDYNDNYMIQFTHESGSKGVLVVDVVSPVAVRKLELYKENSYLSWNGTPDSLMEYNSEKDTLEYVHLHETQEHMEGYRAFVVENAYRNEIKEFMHTIKGEITPEYGFAQDLEVLKLIDTLEAQK